MLEHQESFNVTLSSLDPFIIIPPLQESIEITIEEDPLDGWSLIVLLNHNYCNIES